MISTCCVAVPPPRYGGTELVIHELARALVARGHRVTVYATGDSNPAGELRARWERPVWPPDPYSELIHAHWSCSDLTTRRERPDIVHAHTASALAFADRLDVPVVYTVHHDRQQHLVEFYQYFDRIEYAMISARQSDLHPEIVRRHVVHHGIESDRFRLGPGGEAVAFLGRFAPEKGVHVAIDAACDSGVPIVLGGEAHPHEHAYFEREVAPRLARPGVEWRGEVGGEKKTALLGNARALLFPIEWEEPFGLVMIESMLCGTPVIGFRRGSVPEVIDDGVTGFVVDTPDEMRAALAKVNSLDRARVRERARERWDVSRMADRYAALYEHAISARRTR